MPLPPQDVTDDIPSEVEQICEIIRDAGLRVVAKVRETPAFDILFMENEARLFIVRWVETSDIRDIDALSRMLASGDFSWTLVVCRQTCLQGLAAQLVTTIDQLPTHLIGLKRAP